MEILIRQSVLLPIITSLLTCSSLTSCSVQERALQDSASCPAHYSSQPYLIWRHLLLPCSIQHTSHCGPWNNARASVPILVIRASFTETQEFLFLKLVNLGTLLSIIITIDLEHINLPPNNLLIVRSCQPVSGSGYLEWSTSSWLLTFVTMPGNVVRVEEENTIHRTYLDLVYIINVRMWISEINELNKMYIYECGPGARCVEMSWPWWAPALLRSSTSHLSASHSTSRMGEHAGVNIHIVLHVVYQHWIHLHSLSLLEWRRKCSFQFTIYVHQAAAAI